MNLTPDILNQIKHNLKNAFNSERDFSALFPKENFDFSNTNYTHFLYFAKEEAEEYVKDFLLFIKTYYNEEVFSHENYYSIFNEFMNYCENHNIFLYTKTKMGLKLTNNSNNLLLNELQNLFGHNVILGDESNIAFSESVLNGKTEYTYQFFNFLTQKMKGYNNHSFIIEPLLVEDIEKIKNYYKGVPYKGPLPFYLDPNGPDWKETKNILLSKVVSDTPSKAYVIAQQNKKIVCLIIANVDNDKCSMTIMCESEYYNSNLSDPITFICRDIFNEFNISKISTINENTGLAFSGINSVLTIAHFKPDYSLQSDLNGYSKIKYELTKETNAELEIKVNNSLIKLVL